MWLPKKTFIREYDGQSIECWVWYLGEIKKAFFLKNRFKFTEFSTTGWNPSKIKAVYPIVKPDPPGELEKLG